MTGAPDRVVVDTSVFVGAGFSPDSGAGRTVQAVRDGRCRMPWTESTRHEVKAVLRSIPPLDWSDVEGLFRDEDRHDPEPDAGGLHWVQDPDDRKFAALARATDAILVSNDQDFLARRSEASFTVLSSSEFADRL